MNNWIDNLTPSKSSIKIAKELDAYHDIPPAMDLVQEKPEAISTPDPAPPVPAAPHRMDIRATLLKTISSLTSASCAITSVYFSYLWFIASQPRFIAGIMSVTIVATLTTAPELAITLARKKGYFGAVIVMAIAMVAMLFSMSSTIGGIYNARTDALRTEVSGRDLAGESERLAAQSEITMLADRIKRTQVSLESDQGAVESYHNQISAALDDGAEPDSRRVALLVSNRNYAINRVNASKDEIRNAEDRIGVLLQGASERVVASSVEQRKDFNLWLGERFGISQDQMEFVMAAFPAVFIDVVAPAMLAVAFSL